jgi:hypothetical protein
MGQLRHGTWLKVGVGADSQEILALAVTNPFDSFIP